MQNAPFLAVLTSAFSRAVLGVGWMALLVLLVLPLVCCAEQAFEGTLELLAPPQPLT